MEIVRFDVTIEQATRDGGARGDWMMEVKQVWKGIFFHVANAAQSQQEILTEKAQLNGNTFGHARACLIVVARQFIEHCLFEGKLFDMLNPAWRTFGDVLIVITSKEALKRGTI